jgi:hypothetical protein
LTLLVAAPHVSVRERAGDVPHESQERTDSHQTRCEVRRCRLEHSHRVPTARPPSRCAHAPVRSHVRNVAPSPVERPTATRCQGRKACSRHLRVRFADLRSRFRHAAECAAAHCRDSDVQVSSAPARRLGLLLFPMDRWRHRSQACVVKRAIDISRTSHRAETWSIRRRTCVVTAHCLAKARWLARR